MLDAMDEMQKNVSFRTRSQDTFVLSFSHENPETAQAVLANLAESMIADYSSDNLDSALTTHEVLQMEVDSAQKQVEETSRALARFLAQHPQFTWGVGDSPYASGQQASALPVMPRESKDSPIFDGALAQLVERLHVIDAELAGSDAAPIAISPLVLEAQKQRDAAAGALAAAEADLEQKLLKVTKVHPDAMIAQAHIDRARTALASAETNLTQTLAGMVVPIQENAALDPRRRTELQTQRQTIASQIAARRAGRMQMDMPTIAAPQVNGAVPDVVELETEWHKLRLDLERARDSFRKAEDKERTARLQANSAEREVQEALIVSDPAYLPIHPESGRGRVFFAGFVMAIFFAFGYAGARVLLCDTLFDEGDVLALGDPTLLVSVPHIPNVSASFVVSSRQADTDSKPKKKYEPLVRQDQPTRKTSDISTVNNAKDSFDEPIAPPTGGSLMRSVIPPATALHTYTEPCAPNLVIIGVPCEPSVDPTDDVSLGSSVQVLGALRVLRHRLEQQRGDDSLVVSVQSASEGEGKTTIATRLAFTLAESERARVVLVEGNLSRPKLASTLGLRLPNDLGMTTQIRRRMGGYVGAWSVARIGTSMYALAESTESSVFPGALHSLWFPAIIRELKAAYDYVLIDGCPVLDAGDANVLEEVSDTVVLIARAGVTSGGRITNAVRLLGDRRIFGLVLNDVPTRLQ